MLFLATMGIQLLPSILLFAQDDSSRPVSRGMIKLVVAVIGFGIYGVYRYASGRN